MAASALAARANRAGLSLRCVQDGELDFWKEQDNPILRMRNYLKLQGWYTDEEEQELRDLSRQQVLEALVAAEKIAPLSPDECAACPLALRMLAQDSFVQDLRGFEAERVLVCCRQDV